MFKRFLRREDSSPPPIEAPAVDTPQEQLGDPVDIDAALAGLAGKQVGASGRLYKNARTDLVHFVLAGVVGQDFT